jgi:hypothetical protein
MITGGEIMRTDEVKTLMIGKDIPWNDIKRKIFRVEAFLPVSTLGRNEIANMSLFSARAILKVYNREFKDKAEIIYMPVTHKKDFTHLWELYVDRHVSENEEVELQYLPQDKGLLRLFRNVLPRLLIKVRPKGSMELIAGV